MKYIRWMLQRFHFSMIRPRLSRSLMAWFLTHVLADLSLAQVLLGFHLLREFLVSGNMACWLMLELGEKGSWREGAWVRAGGLCMLSPTKGRAFIIVIIVLCGFFLRFGQTWSAWLLMWYFPRCWAHWWYHQTLALIIMFSLVVEVNLGFLAFVSQTFLISLYKRVNREAAKPNLPVFLYSSISLQWMWNPTLQSTWTLLFSTTASFLPWISGDMSKREEGQVLQSLRGAVMA